MIGPPAHVAIDGQLYTVLGLDDVEAYAHRNSLTITYPEVEGWATCAGREKCAAWFPAEGKWL